LTTTNGTKSAVSLNCNFQFMWPWVKNTTKMVQHFCF